MHSATYTEQSRLLLSVLYQCSIWRDSRPTAAIYFPVTAKRCLFDFNDELSRTGFSLVVKDFTLVDLLPEMDLTVILMFSFWPPATVTHLTRPQVLQGRFYRSILDQKIISSLGLVIFLCRVGITGCCRVGITGCNCIPPETKIVSDSNMRPIGSY